RRDHPGRDRARRRHRLRGRTPAHRRRRATGRQRPTPRGAARRSRGMSMHHTGVGGPDSDLDTSGGHRATRPSATIRARNVVLVVALALLLISIVRFVTNADEMDSPGSLQAAIIATCPILLA